MLSLLLLLSLPWQTTGGDAQFFEKDVFPLIETNCFKCHGPGPRIKGGLRLTSREAVLDGGESGAIVDLERPEASPLMSMLSYVDELHQMPPSGKLAEDDIAIFQRWIEAGIPWSDSIHFEVAKEEEEQHAPSDGMEGWSYTRVERPDVPGVRDADWISNPIDAFVLARLEAAGLAPAPRASKGALIRRVTQDLTGLPPTPEEVQAFLDDDSEGAWAKLIDRLLASPQYGVKWARHWLDLMRYAETNGYERDSDKRWIWRYRDWVVDAFNSDLPYDRFIIEQLAGDEIPEPTPQSITATGYHRLMIWDDEPGNGREQARYDVLADNVSTTSQAFLGMSLGCARCHDHKKDPVSQKDFYSFMAFFQGLTDHSIDHSFSEIMTPEERATYESELAQKRADEERLQGELRVIEEKLRRELARIESQKPVGGSADLLDLTYHFYRDSWERLPDFDMLLAEETGALPGGRIDLSPATRDEDFGFVFRGKLVVPRDAKYTFRLQASGGARLSIDGATVIDHDGLHSPADAATATVELTEGTLPVRLDMFHRSGKPVLELWWSEGADSPWRYTFENADESWFQADFDETSWRTGEPGFGARGTPGSVIGTEWRTHDIWMRKTFEWSLADADDLTLVGHYDDDIHVYINGVLAAHRTGYVTKYLELGVTDEGRAALREGTNSLAVHCVQDFGGQYVHVEPARKSHAAGTNPAQLAFGRRALHVDSSELDALPPHELFERHGDEVLGKEETAAWRALEKELKNVQRRRVEPKLAMSAQEREHVPDMFVHVRGNAAVRGDMVEPAFPTVLGFPPPQIPERAQGAKSSGRRLALAEWIANPENPLTARVIVNRVWQHHFGRGIVRSSNDFGELGDRPTHPELLDWLASEFVERGWSMKELHRLIVTSSVWRSASVVDGDVASVTDPTNDLFWHFPLRRLTAEELRDGIIAMTGKLNLEMGGPSFYEPMPEEVLATSSRPDAVWGRSSEEQTRRRAIYIKVKRSLVAPLLASFDLADTDNTCAERFTTTQPTQALSLLNGDFIQLQSSAFAQRLREEAGADEERQIERALWLAFQRAPTAEEIDENVAFLRSWRDDFGGEPAEALDVFCLMILNLNEFAYLD